MSPAGGQPTDLEAVSCRAMGSDLDMGGDEFLKLGVFSVGVVIVRAAYYLESTAGPLSIS